MMKVIEGRVLRLGHNFGSDAIYPDRHPSTGIAGRKDSRPGKDLKQGLPFRLKTGDIIVAGKSFGYGQPFQQAASALKIAGAACLVAESFARRFYRSAINLGLPSIENEDALDKIGNKEIIRIDFESGEISCKKGILKFRILPDFIMRMLDVGGLMQCVQKLNR